jgi:hypothetical protein
VAAARELKSVEGAPNPYQELEASRTQMKAFLRALDEAETRLGRVKAGISLCSAPVGAE